MKKIINQIRTIFLITVVLFTVLLGVSLFWNISEENKSVVEYSKVEAIASFNKDLLYRRWAAMHGGVYVPVSEATQPNPYLEFLPNRDVETKDGQMLTLVNPAYMTRQVFEFAQKQYGVKCHITSLKPLRPENKPDSWEEKALQSFQNDTQEYYGFDTIDNVEYLRYMHTMVTEKSCLKCHASQGYRAGDMRGGISVSIPSERYRQSAKKQIKNLIFTYIFIYLIVIISTYFAFSRLIKAQNISNLAKEKLLKHETLLTEHNFELKAAKEKAEKSENRLNDILNKYNEIQEVAQIGSWDWDIITNQVWWSEGTYKIFEVSKDEFIPDFENNAQFIAPEEKENYYAEFKNSIEAGSLLNHDFKLITKAGKIKYCAVKGKVIYNADNKAVRFIGSILDISKYKDIESSLKQKNLELKIAKENAEESELKYRLAHTDLCEAQKVAKIGSWKWKIKEDKLEWSDEMFNIFGVDKNSFTGKLDDILQQRIHPHDIDHVIASNISASTKGKPIPLEYRVIIPDGFVKTVWAEAGELIKDKNGEPLVLSGIVKDITEQKRLEQIIIEDGKNYENIFTNSPVGIFVVDIQEDGEYVYNSINPFSEKILGVKNEEISGKTLKYIEQKFGGDIEKYVRNLYDDIIKTKTTISIDEDLMLGEKHIQVKTSIRPLINSKGLVYRLIGSNIDISHQKQIEKELKQAKEKAEESDRLKSSFLQNMSHEVRTPLNAIIGFSQQIAETNLEPQKRKAFFKIVTESSRKLLAIITDVIEISQVHTKLLKVNFAEFDFIELITKVVSEFSGKAAEKKIELVFLQNISQPTFIINSDQDKIERIVIHLIDNAIKFTQKGYVEVLTSIKLNSLQISVSDSGIGIPENLRNVVFEPFRQVETGATRNYGGTGLGLALVKAYTELLKGSLSVQSEINQGSTFLVSLPIPEKSVANNPNILNIMDNPVKTILIAEDEYSNYQYLLELLNDTFINVIHATNGLQAVEMCKNDTRIDFILMDIKMPIMDGFTAAKQIKEFRPEIPIIAQTAFALQYEIELFKSVFDDYITKPISEKVLKETLSKYLDIK